MSRSRIITSGERCLPVRYSSNSGIVVTRLTILLSLTRFSRRKFPTFASSSTISIFILPPSLEVLQERLIARNQDSMEVISQRMIKAQEVMSFAQGYDYQIVNNIFEDSLQQILDIINQNIASKSNQEIKRYTYFKF